MKAIQIITSQLTRFYIIYLFALSFEIIKNTPLYLQIFVACIFLLYSVFDYFKLDVISFNYLIVANSSNNFIFIGSIMNLLINMFLIFLAKLEMYNTMIIFLSIDLILPLNGKRGITEILTLKKKIIKGE